MAMISDQELRKAASQADYERGEALFRAGGVLRCRTEGWGLITVDGHVRDDDRVTTTTVHYEFYRSRVSCLCSCGHKKADKVCCHSVALLLAWQHGRSSDSFETDDEQVLDSLLDTYLQQEEHDEPAETVQTEPGSIRLVPEIGCAAKGDKRLKVSFRIGGDKLYVLKSISDLLENVKQRRTVSYGKQLAFRHAPEVFDEPSRRLLELMMVHEENVRQVAEQI